MAASPNRNPEGPRTGIAAATQLYVPRLEAAFTLIEVMLAMTIFAMVMIAIYASWTAVLRASKAGLQAAAEAQRTRISIQAIRQALTSGQLYMPNVRYYWFM